MQQWAQDLKKKRMADNSKDNPDVWCLPIGLMQYHNHPQPSQIVQAKNIMLITYESNYGLRYVYLDGRPAPNNDPQPWWFGYSRGRWEGNDTLVVETTHFNSEERASWHDVNGTPWSDAAQDDGTLHSSDVRLLQVDVTIDDPKTFAKPFTVRVFRNLLVGLGNDRVHLQRERAVNRPYSEAWSGGIAIGPAAGQVADALPPEGGSHTSAVLKLSRGFCL